MNFIHRDVRIRIYTKRIYGDMGLGMSCTNPYGEKHKSVYCIRKRKKEKENPRVRRFSFSLFSQQLKFMHLYNLNFNVYLIISFISFLLVQHINTRINEKLISGRQRMDCIFITNYYYSLLSLLIRYFYDNLLL